MTTNEQSNIVGLMRTSEQAKTRHGRNHHKRDRRASNIRTHMREMTTNEQANIVRDMKTTIQVNKRHGRNDNKRDKRANTIKKTWGNLQQTSEQTL